MAGGMHRGAILPSTTPGVLPRLPALLRPVWSALPASLSEPESSLRLLSVSSSAIFARACAARAFLD